MRPLFLLLLLFAPLAAQAVTLPDGRVIQLQPFHPASWAANLPPRELWRLSAPANYAYRVQRRCYCPGPSDARVYVVQGKVAAVEDLQSGETLTDAGTLRQFRPMAGYFDLLDQLWRQHPAVFDVRHDRQYGFPRRIQVDPAYNVADDEVDLRIWELSGLSITPPQIP